MLDSNLELDDISARFLASEKAKISPEQQLKDLFKRNGISDDQPKGDGSIVTPMPSSSPSPQASPGSDKGYLSDVGTQALVGPVVATQELLNSFVDAGNWIESNGKKFGLFDSNYIPDDFQFDFADKNLPKADTLPGKFAREMAQFALPFLGGMKAIKGIKYLKNIGKIPQGVIVGSGVNLANLDPHEERLSNFINQSGWGNIVTEYLAADPKDSAMEGRFKNAIEGALTGVAGEAFFASVKALKGIRWFKKGPEQVIEGQMDAGPSTIASMELGGPKQTVDDVGEVVAKDAVDGPPSNKDVADAVRQEMEVTDVEGSSMYAADDIQKNLGRLEKSKAKPPKAPTEANPPGAMLGQAPENTKDIGLDVINESTKEVSERLRLDKYDLVNNADKVISTIEKKFAGSIDEARRGTIKETEMRLLAEETGLSVEDVLKRGIGETWSAEKIRAAREVYTGVANHVTGYLDKVITGKATEKELGEFIESFNVFRQYHEQVMGLRAESGRALQAWKSFADMPDGIRMDAIRQQITALGSREGLEDVAMALKQAMGKSKNKTEALARVASISRFTNFKDAAYSTWYNLLLSNIKTLSANVISNTVAQTMRVGEKLAGTTFSQLSSDSEKIAFKELAANYAGMLQGSVDGLKIAWETMRTGMSHFGPSKAGLDVLDSKNIRYMDDVQRSWINFLVPSNYLEATDGFFKAVTYRSELNGRAVREGLSLGLSGERLNKYVQKAVQNPSEELHLAALKEAQTYTFTNPLTAGAKNIDDFVKNTPGMRVIVPFRRTLLNLGQFSLNRNPLGLVLPNSRLREELAMGGPTARLAQAKVALGSTIMGTFAMWAMEGKITGQGPLNPQARREREMTGWRPYSYKIGDTYYSYAKIDPIRTMAGMAADFADFAGQRMDDKDYPNDEVALTAVFLAMEGATPGFLLEGFSLLSDAINGDGSSSAARRLVENLATGPLPGGLLRQMQRSHGDNVKRDTTADPNSTNKTWDEIVNRIYASLPGGGKDMPEAMNVWGETIHYDPGWGPDIASPITTSKEDKSPIAKEIIRLGMTQGQIKPILKVGERDLLITMPPRVIQEKIGPARVSIKLSPKEYAEFVKMSAGIGLDGFEPLKQYLNDQAKNGYPDAPGNTDSDHTRRLFIAKTVQKYRDAAQKQLKMKVSSVWDKFEGAMETVPNLYMESTQDVQDDEGDEE